MIEFIKSISGPEFLLYYLILVVVSYVLYQIYLKRSDAPLDYVIPDSMKPGAMEIAVLKSKGKPAHIIKTVMVGLFDKKLIEIRSDGTICKIADAKNKDLGEIEKIILNYFASPQAPNSIFTNSSIKMTISEKTIGIIEKLKDSNLLKNDVILGRQRRVYAFFFIGVTGIGFIKLILGIMRDKPVLFLILLLILTIFLYAFSYPKKYSAFGKKYLQYLARQMSGVRDYGNNQSAFPETMDPVMICALFGMGALFAFPEYSAMGSVFPNRNVNYSGCTSCSTSSSGCSSCSGGGGDGGGDAGGGGCGGCGGGGD
ncbi:MAG: TIGR04222 domain-containing membrane protein [Bacteroidia bacterium]|nr:TIGR04222 domain-containing membrane protein [Bacteroidia bacterium]